MSVQQNIAVLFGALLQDVEQLKHDIRDVAYCDAHTYTLPRFTVANEADIALPPFKVEHRAGEDALEQALNHFSEFLAPKILGDGATKISTKFTHRLPGVLVCMRNNSLVQQNIVARVEAINARKKAFHEAVLSLSPYATERFNKLRHIVPGIILLQATRNLRAIQGAAQSVRFNWEHRHVQREWDRDKLIERLLEVQDSPYWGTSEHSGSPDKIDRLIMDVHAESSQVRFYERRPMKAVPVVKVSLDVGGRSPKLITAVAHSPVILFTDSKPKHIIHLKDYEGEPERNNSAYTLVDSRLNLYKK